MILGVLQARTSSSRLPGKILMPILGIPMLAHQVRRLLRGRRMDGLVLATSDQRADDPVQDLAAGLGVGCFRGSLEDVLDRFYQAAAPSAPDHVVRLTGDCPLTDHGIVDQAIDLHLESDADYTSNTLEPTWPDGLDVEVVRFSCLREAWQEARLGSEREHVTPFINRRPGRYCIRHLKGGRDLSAMRWTVDEPEDFEFARRVYEALYPADPDFRTADVLALLEKEPGLADLNRKFRRNEGLEKSLENDRKKIMPHKDENMRTDVEEYALTLAKGAPMPPKPLPVAKSLEWKARAEKLIPSCTQTFSKGPTQFVQGMAPVFLEKGKGCRVTDVDGNEYIDYPMALGPIILGHAYPAVNQAVISQMAGGTAFSLPHRLEVEVAEILTDLIPCAEMVRFAKNGSDVTSGAIRAARAFTGREHIACCGYHGWHDWYIGTTTRDQGVPKAVSALTHAFNYNDPESLERIFQQYPGQIAAVILEPFGVVQPKDGFLEKVKAAAHRNGALLVFDEVVTGFRLSLGGAQEYFKVTPDLACFGKAMANGFPISTVVGRRDIMKIFDEIFFSFTFGGETASLAAAKATLAEMKAQPVIKHLWRMGERLRDGFNALAGLLDLGEHASCQGLGPRTLVSLKDKDGVDSLLLKSLFQQECLKRGVLFAGAQNICYSHSQADIDHTLAAYRASLEILADAIRADDVEKRLEGKPVQAVFRKP